MRCGGSSPLARGLLLLVVVRPLAERIIPARAGFTGAGCEVQAVERDHPRSRGVYRARLRNASEVGGSSPLARGLPGSSRGNRPPRMDHPRSRGVYSLDRSNVATRSGSSPLARGLRCPTASASLTPGIIPARAGFTSSYKEDMAKARDHPRSRGVYRTPRNGSDRHCGSSPLARGLRARV